MRNIELIRHSQMNANNQNTKNKKTTNNNK